MKKLLCFLPKADPDDRDENASTTALAGSPRSTNTADATDTAPASDSASASASTSTRNASASGSVSSALRINFGKVPIQQFCYIQLQFATNSFRLRNFLGRGGFGDVYIGNLAPQNQEVAVKRLLPNSKQGTREFVAEIETLSNSQHENIVRLIGYCAENQHKLLVYEYMSKGSLAHHLLDRQPGDKIGILDWNTRVRIAYEVAKGVEYLHDKMDPHMIYRDLKCANILLGEGYSVKLSDFGCAKIAPPDEQLNITRVLGSPGYCDPNYFATGNLTFKADVYSFGVVLLELITGRKGLDETKPDEDRSLVLWARRVFGDNIMLIEIVDPLLEGRYSELVAHSLVNIAKLCLQDEPDERPKMSHLVDMLKKLHALADEGPDPRVRMLSRCHTIPSYSAAGVRFRS